jgi:CheY-like chemotaxis protein
VADARASQVLVSLPEALELKERRSQPRARLNPKEGATLTALTGLFEGVGITGLVENLSEGGARVRVEKAMNLKGEKRLPLSAILVPPGQPFMLVKLNHAPKCPAVMELEGRAVFLDQNAGGLVMGIAFGPPKADVTTALRGLVASRTVPIPAALPPKARRKPEAAPVEPGLAGGGLGEHRPAGSGPKAPKEPDPAHEETRPADARPPEPAAAAPAQAGTPEALPAARNEAILRLRKRSRAVVALAPTPAFADQMKAFLREQGFGRVLVTTERAELQEHLQQPNLAVLFLDGNLGNLDALHLVNDLQNSLPALPPTILAVEEASTSLVLAARRHGVAQVLVKPYALDAAFCAALIQKF